MKIGIHSRTLILPQGSDHLIYVFRTLPEVFSAFDRYRTQSLIGGHDKSECHFSLSNERYKLSLHALITQPATKVWRCQNQFPSYTSQKGISPIFFHIKDACAGQQV